MTTQSGRPFLLCMSPIPAEAFRAMIEMVLPGMEVDVYALDSESNEEVVEFFRRADVVLGDFTFRWHVTAEMLAGAERLKLIAQPSIGYQHIDIEAARAAGIPVVNTAGANAVGVAEHTIMFMLCLLKKALYAHTRTSAGHWGQVEMFGMNVRELQGKIFGIIGMGRIGQEVATRARCFGCPMVYYDPHRLAPETEAELQLSYRDLPELLRESDIISLHVPLTAQTEKLIGATELDMMKPGAILLNLARGEVIDEEAVAAALVSGHLSGAGIDVFTEEPVSPDNPLLTAPNVMLSPHTAGTTDESRGRMIEVTLANIQRVLTGGRLVNVVNGVE